MSRVVTSNSATSTTPSVSVPSNAAVDTLVWLTLATTNNVENDAAVAAAAPAGFEFVFSAGTSTQGTRGRILHFWKRMTGTDSGSYTFGTLTSSAWELTATGITGRVRVGKPWNALYAATTGAVSGATTLSCTGITPGSSTADVIGTAGGAVTGDWTPPSGFTEIYDAGGISEVFNLTTGAAAATGAFTVTRSTAGFLRGTIIALAADDHVDTRSVGNYVFTSAAAQTPALPTHEPGDRISVVVIGKDQTTTVPSISSGWTLVGSGTGGTGSLAADTGQMFWAVWQRDVVSGESSSGGTPISDPTITPGATAPNTWMCEISVATPSTGMVWRDAIGASADYVKAISDTDAATSVTGGTASAMTGQPTTGDAIHIFGGFPTDAMSTCTALAASASGLTDGTVAAPPTSVVSSTPQTTQSVSVFNRNSFGFDCAMAFFDWVEFNGTASSGITASFTHNATNQSGVVIVVAHRQQAAGISSSATVAETATLTSAGTVGKAIGAALAATAAITAVGVVGTSSGASISETATLTAAGDVLAANEGSADITGTATVTGTGVVGTSTGATLDATATITAAGATGFTGSAAIDATATVTAAGAKGYTGTAAITAAATLTAAGAVSEPGASGATVTATVEITAEGVVVSYDTDTSNDDDGIYLGDGYAEVVWDPGVVPIPTVYGPLPAEYYTVVKVVDTAPVGRGPATARQLAIPAAIDRVLIDNVDFTFYDGAAAVVEGMKLIDPLLYGNATIVIPAINPQFPSDLGDLVACFRFARVRIQRVLDGTVVATDHKGFVSRVDCSGTELRLEIGGQAAGALSQLYVPPPVYRRKQDVEHILVDTLRDARVQAKEHDGESGVGLIRRGGSDGLSIFNETLAVWAGSTGQAITFTPNANGVYRKTQKPGPEDDADFTCYPSDLVQIDLSQDFMEQFTRVYAQGYTAAGQLVANIKTPGLTQGEAPPLDSTLMPGDEGGQVGSLQEQLALHDYLDLDDVTPGVFDAETVAAVLAFKYDSEDLVSLTPEVGEPAWNALWNLSEIGYSLDDAREYPTAADPTAAKWLRTANGSKLKENPNYDPHLIPNDTFIDVGGPFGKGQIRDFARSKLAPEGGIWSGTITLRSGVVAGVHNPGDPFTTADIMDRRDVLPNMKAWLPYFGGGVEVYVSGVDHSGDTTQLLVSTVPQTTMEVWQALERRKEAKSNPGRSWSGHTRASQVRNDKGPQWDTSSGLIANDVALVSGWNEIKVPAGQAGIVQRVKVQLADPDEFAMLLTQKPVSVTALNANDATATPLVDPRPSARPWFEREAVIDWLEDRAYLDAWGTPKQPCGYDPSLKEDENGPTAEPITGLFKENAGLNYETGSEPVLYLYVWVGSGNTLQRGRVLRNQRTTDF